MTRYATVWSDVWDDDRFLKCSNDAKVLYMFLISNHATNLIGYYQAPRNLAQASLSFGTEEFDTILNEIADAGLIAISSDRKYVLIKGYLKFNKINGDSQFKKLKVELEHIERNSLDSTFVSEINRFCFKEAELILTQYIPENMSEFAEITQTNPITKDLIWS